MKRTPRTTLTAAFLAAGAFAAPFAEIDTNFTTKTHAVPAAPVKSKILFRGLVDTVHTPDGKKTLAKDWHDFTGYVPIDGRSDSGYVIVNHEMIVADSLLGDGGGMTVFTAALKNDEWSVVDHPKGKFRNVDFSEVGGTLANCGGLQTPWGTVMTAEEWNQASNVTIHDNGKGIRDTSDFTIVSHNGQTVNKTIKRFQNFNWMVEVDPAQAKAVRKNYNMGRFDHEGGYAMPDKKTVYLTDDATPGAFFKFVAEQEGSYEKGQLYAYKQTDDGMGGTWLELPMDLDSLLVIRDVAISRGATMFTRHEWIEMVDGKIYITETGRDKSAAHYQTQRKIGGTIAKHLRDRLPTGETVTLYTGEKKGDSTITDYFGRVLVFDPTTNKMSVHLEGGPGSNGKHFTNPDGLVSVELNGKKYLIIQEDVNGLSQGRVPAYAEQAQTAFCELYWLDLSIVNPKVDDLKRMMVTPAGAEITGARFTPDGKSMFVNIQHPDENNPAPYNTSYTVVLTGYADGGASSIFLDGPKFPKSGKLELMVDNMGLFVYFNRKTDIELYNGAGKRISRHKNVNQIDIAMLKPGNYYLKAGRNDVRKLMVH